MFLNGTVGAGKSTVAEAVARALSDDGVPNAVIDLDWLRLAWPAPAGDPFSQQLALANLTAVVPNFLAEGTKVLILAGVIEEAGDRCRYERALRGNPLLIVRLEAPLAVVHQRLRSRHDPHDPALDWHLHRAGELQDILQAAGLDDAVVNTGKLEVKQAAAAVLELFHQWR